MFDDDLEPKKKNSSPRNLEPMSIEELDEYIVDLKNEIVRTEDEIKRKKAHHDAAASIFKS